MTPHPDSIQVYVSPSGKDSWSGRSALATADAKDGPFATLARAVKAIRQLRLAQGHVRPATVWLRDGRYHITSALVLEPVDSHITFAAHESGKPVIDGGVRIDGWAKTHIKGVNAWVADASSIVDRFGYFHQLFVKGQRATRPRFPKEGVYWMEGAPDTDVHQSDNGIPVQKSMFIAGPAKFGEWKNLSDVEVVIPHWWIEDRRNVKSYDPVSRLVTLAEDTLYPLIDDLNPSFARYYVENVVEALSEPGEWYLDRSTKEVYYIPRDGESPADAEIIAPVTEHLLRIEGRPLEERFVDAVTFRGVTFEHGEWKDVNRSFQAAYNVPSAVRMKGARNCALLDCAIQHVGVWALELGEGCMNNRVCGCTITDIGGGGIKVMGTDVNGPASCRTGTTRITDNEIGPVGCVHHSATGVLLGHTFGNYVAHNHIHDMFYTGVSVGFKWGYGPSIACNNRIEKNHIHHCGRKLLNDMGGVYLLGVQAGTTIRGNVIHDIHGHMYGGWGIYPDEGSSHLVIEDNIVYDTSSQLFHLHFGRENAVRNNIWAFANEGLIAISRGTRLSWADKEAFPNGHTSCCFVFERNIVVTDGQPVFIGGMDDETGNIETRSFVSDLNLFHDVGGKPVTSANAGHLLSVKGVRRSFTWEEMRNLGYDMHSERADPGFADLEGRDFSLGPDSPAIALGFKPIDVSDVGPRPVDKRIDDIEDCRDSPWIGFM